MGRIILQPTPQGKGTGIAHNSRRRRRKVSLPLQQQRQAASASSSPEAKTKDTTPPPKSNAKAKDAILNEKHGGPPALTADAQGLIAIEKPLFRPRQTLAIDTRLLLTNDDETPKEKEEQASQLYKNLLQDLVSTGAIPTKIAFLGRTESSIVIDTNTVDNASQLQSMTIQPVVFRVESDDILNIPKPLLPKNTWKLIRGLVDNVCQQDEPKSQGDTSPYEVTLVMRASSLMVGDHLNHSDGLAATVDHLGVYFAESKIQSVRIILTGSSSDADVSSSLAPTLESALQTALCEKMEAADTFSPHVENNKTTKPGLPVAISIHAVEESPSGYKKLVRQLVRQSLGGSSLSTGRLCIDLPETIEGMQCELLLDAEYNLLPTSLQNHFCWEQLSLDLQALSTNASLEVQQMIPYSALDASLLFGIPLRVSASARSGDCQDYQTMQVLFQSLLSLLQVRELVLLLKVPESTTGGIWFGRPLQNLVLMVRETTFGSVPTPQTALVFGYATATQCLLEEDGMATSASSSLDKDMTAQLQSYVDESLEQVPCGPYNPLVDRATDLWNTLELSQQDEEAPEGEESMQE